uniref:Uncharacterized protein n=1 Tax=Glossina morsitans morsitans TaxID=37546 RepID=A0A1B0FNJ9_GLOMM
MVWGAGVDVALDVVMNLLQTAISLAVDDGYLLEPTDYTPEYQNGMPKRVGLRKRKRRPQTGTSIRSTALANNQYWRGHIDDDDLREQNNNIKEDNNNKGEQSKEYRRPQKNAEANVKLLDAFKREQKPNDKNEKLHENQQNLVSTSPPVNLKNLLKNTGGLSLSEILQQQNLSLDDLLKGKQNAILALQTTSLPQIKQKPNVSQILTKPKIVGENREDAEEKTKILAMQRLKLFGTASRPLNDINARKKEYLNAIGTTVMMTASSGADLSKPTTVVSSTTRVPIYKKILHQRSTLKPTFLLTNATIAPVNAFTDYMERKPEKNLTNESEEEMEFLEDGQEDEIETEQHDENLDTENISLLEDIEDLRKQNVDATTSNSNATTITEKPIQNKLTVNSRRSGYTTTGQLTRTTRRFNYASSNSPTTTSSKITPTTPPITSTSTNIMLTTTTTASSSTMNLTPKAHTMFNSEQLKERIQESLLKNLIDKNDKQTGQHRATYNNNGDDDLENFFDDAVKIKSRKPVETSTLITKMRQFSTSTVSSNNKKSHYNEFLPDFDNVDDRTDLLELIEDRRSGNRLFKVLEQRNMTLEELIEHRKRGSSQLHLATIVENPAGLFPDKRVVLQDNMDIVTAFENFPHFNLLNLKSVKPDDIKTDSQGSSYFTSIIDIEPTDEIYKSGGEGAKTETRVSHINIPNKNSKSLSFFPAWKTLALASLATRITNNAQAITPSLSNTFYLPQPKLLFENHSADEEDVELNENKLFMLSNDTMDADESNEVAYNSGAIKPMQAAIRLADNTIHSMENEVMRAHDLVDLELSGHGFKRSSTATVAVSMTGQKQQNSFYTNISAGIKSAIVASTTIVLTALITFMLIFVVCRWKQRGLTHHSTRNSNNSSLIKTYNVMKSKLPALITGTTTTTTTTLTTAGQNSSSTTRCTARQKDNNPIAVVATITTTSNSAVNNGKNSNSQQLQRQSSLLFQRNASSKNYHQQHQPQNKTTKLSRLSGHKQTNLRNNEKSSSSSLLSVGGGASTAAVGGGLLGVSCNNLGSTTSLAFSLTSNSSTKLNAMDTNSPEVQEYLFDTLRNSF